MLLEVDDSKTIGELQDKFSRAFRNLKIEFFPDAHYWEGLSAEKDKFPPETVVGVIRRNYGPAVLEIKSLHTVGRVEKYFYTRMGLNVQVFFRKGGRWIQTGRSDNMTIRFLQYASMDEPTLLL